MARNEEAERHGDPFKAVPLKARGHLEDQTIELTIIAYPSDRSNPARMLTAQLVLHALGGCSVRFKDEPDGDGNAAAYPHWLSTVRSLLSRE